MEREIEKIRKNKCVTEKGENLNKEIDREEKTKRNRKRLCGVIFQVFTSEKKTHTKNKNNW